MIFPVGDDQIKGGYKPIFSYSILVINVVVFLYEVVLQNSGQLSGFVNDYGAIPVEITHGVDIYTLFTNMFLHGDWMHLMGNMLFLWIFADNIEASIGNFRFLMFYLGGGILASLAHVALNPGSSIPSIGASGAISAVMGCYLVMFPRSRVKVLVIYFFRAFYVSAIIFLGFWIIFQIFSGVTSLGQNPNSGGVAYWAHIGGFVFGLLYGFFAKRFFQLKGVLNYPGND
ncbi:MAG: rhomboid family intramembrane serine protease [Saprospiraceae bacterium]